MTNVNSRGLDFLLWECGMGLGVGSRQSHCLGVGVGHGQQFQRYVFCVFGSVLSSPLKLMNAVTTQTVAHRLSFFPLDQIAFGSAVCSGLSTQVYKQATLAFATKFEWCGVMV